MDKPTDDGNLDELYQKIVGQIESDPSLDANVAGAKEVLALIARIREHDSIGLESIGLNDGETARAQETLKTEKAYLEFYEDDSESWPAKIGRFEIKRPLGRGGFGIVFLAQDPNLGRDIALKIPRLERVTTPDLKSRFIREGRAVASLAHPNIVPVYESGQVGSICYLASQFVDGETLAQWQSKEQPIPPRVAAEITISLAEAISHAHQRGVLHRDIKPANVLIRKESDSEPTTSFADRILIMDFGLAKIAGDTNEQTRTGAIVGTPAFMSPEQARQETATASSDVYSLGALLYQLLAGKPPLLKDGFLDTLSAVINESPQSPSKINNLVDADLDAICLKCLEKEPAKRYVSAFKLKDDLSDWLNGRPISARRPNLVERCVRWTKFNRTLASSAAIVFAILATATVVSSYFVYQSNIDKQTAFAASKNASASADVALKQTQRISQAIQELFTSVAAEPLIRQPEFANLRRNLYESANGFLKELAVEQSDDPELLKEYFNSLIWAARVYQELGFPSESLTVLGDAESVLQKIESEPGFEMRSAMIKSNKASALSNTGKSKQGLALKLEAIHDCELWHQLHPYDEFHTSVYLAELSSACMLAMEMGDFLAAEKTCIRQQEILEKIHRCEPLAWPAEQHTANCLCNMSWIAENKNDLDGAEALGLRAIEIIRELNDAAEIDHSKPGFDRFDLVNVTRSLAKINSSQGNQEAARSLYADALEILEHPSIRNSLDSRANVVSTQLDLAIVAYDQEDFDLAIIHAEECIEAAEFYQAQSGETNLENLEFRSLSLLHAIYARTGQFDLAEEKLDASVELAEKLHDRDPDNYQIRTELGQVYNLGSVYYISDKRDDEQAEYFTEKSLQLAVSSYQAGKHKTAYGQYCHALTNRAMVAGRMGEPEKELDCLKRYLELGGDRRTEQIRQVLIRVYCGAGQFQNAVDQMFELLSEEIVPDQKFDIAVAIAQAIKSLDDQDHVDEFVDEMAQTAIKALQELGAENYKRGGASFEDLLSNKNFDPIRDLSGFPAE